MNEDQHNKHWIVGITGASGAVYGIRLCHELLTRGYCIHLVITDAGWRVLQEEMNWNAARRKETIEEHFSSLTGKLIYHPNQNIGASIASGSVRTEGMVVIPCSMGTLSGIAHGSSDNLLKRTADVMIKENRKLILVPRETPLHAIHLENMLKLARLGLTIIPAMPAFYNQPKTIDDMISFLVGKVLDSMQIDHEIYKRWGQHHE